MYTESKLRAIGPGKILRGDATGNCCARPTYGEKKRILYYAFVVNVCNINLPVFEFITVEHNIHSIGLQY